MNETPLPSLECAHEWTPIENWYGRYRCTRCGVAGYRGLVTALVGDEARELGVEPQLTVVKRVAAIIPYRCKKRLPLSGAKKQQMCGAPAHSRDGYCRAHHK